jgi:hypothetical protein
VAELPAAPHVARHVSHIMPLLLPFWFLAHGRLFLPATVLVRYSPQNVVERANVLIGPAIWPRRSRIHYARQSAVTA